MGTNTLDTCAGQEPAEAAVFCGLPKELTEQQQHRRFALDFAAIAALFGLVREVSGYKG